MNIKYIQFSKEELIQRIGELEKENVALNRKLINKLIKTSRYNKHVDDNNSLLHNKEKAHEFLLKTSDTLFLLDRNGLCVDSIVKSNHWFLNEMNIIGRNIFELLPRETSKAVKIEFENVIKTKEVSSQNYDLPIKTHMYYFKCIMQMYNDEYILCQYRDITQRSQMKKRLEISNQKLKATEKLAKIGHWVYNTNTKIISYAGQAGILTDNGLELTISLQDYLESVHEKDRDILCRFLEENQYLEKRLDYRIFKKSENANYFVKTQITNIYNGLNGRIIEGYVQNIDNMIKKRTELEFLRYGLNNANDDIFVAHFNGDLIYANYQYREHNTISLDAEISFFTVFDSNILDIDSWTEMLDCLQKNNYYKSTAKKTNPVDGKDLYFDCTSYIIKDQLGVKSVWSFWKNITEQKLAEDNSRQLNQLFNTVLDNIPISVTIKKAETGYRYIYQNKTAKQLYKLSDIDPFNKDDFELYPDSLAERYRREDLSIAESKCTHRYIYEYINEESEIDTIDEIKLLLYDDMDCSTLIITLGWDISDTKRIEKELISAKRKAEESDDLKSAFLSTVSHEIRTPLNAIVGFSRIIAESEDPKERKHYNNIVEANNSRLLALVNEILDFSKIESGTIEFSLQVFNLADLCKELYETYQVCCLRGQKIVYDNDSNAELWLYSDQNRIHQVLSNLLVNALKFTPNGTINIGFRLNDNILEVYVSDTGIGIPEDKIKSVFDRFTKLNPTAPGTGLGLAICRSIIHKLGGDINLSSTIGVGSKFTFTLPYIPIRENKDKETQVSNFEKQYNKDLVILVVEDDQSSFELINIMIGNEYTLLHVKNIFDAVQIFERHEPDMVLINVRMESSDGFNGLDIVKIMRQLSDDICIIALSAELSDKEMCEKPDSGCSDFLPKPLDKEKLREIIHKNIV